MAKVNGPELGVFGSKHEDSLDVATVVTTVVPPEPKPEASLSWTRGQHDCRGPTGKKRIQAYHGDELGICRIFEVEGVSLLVPSKGLVNNCSHFLSQGSWSEWDHKDTIRWATAVDVDGYSRALLWLL